MSLYGLQSRPASNQVARQLQRSVDQVNAETEYTFIVDAAHAFLTNTAIRNMHEVVAELRDALEADPGAGELYAPIVRGYANGVARRISRFAQ